MTVRSTKRRDAFTRLELTVVLAITMILLSVLFPAVQASRESSRRSTCRDHFEQIGLAIHQYHSTFGVLPMHGTGPANERNDNCCGLAMQPGNSANSAVSSRHQLSFLVALLPFCEQQELWDKVSNPHIDEHGNAWPPFGPPPYTANYEPWNTDIPSYRCPSDPGVGGPSLGRTNYACCVGDSMWRTDNASWSYFKRSGWRYAGSNRLRANQVRASVRGIFVPRRQMSFRDVLDGLSNTIAGGEIATGRGEREISTAGSMYNGRDQLLGNPKYCADQGQISREHPKLWLDGEPDLGSDMTKRGFRWADFRPLYTQVNTILPPNSEVCMRGNHGQDGVMPPSSRHDGGAHVLLADGAVVFMTDSVEAGDSRAPVIYLRDSNHQHDVGKQSPYGLWGAIGTRASNERLESG